MHYWLVRATARHHDLYTVTTVAHRVTCSDSKTNPRCRWKTVEVGDLVALVRVRNRALFGGYRYSPGVVAFGQVTDVDRNSNANYPAHTGSIVYSQVFFDAPVTLHRMTATGQFTTSMFNLSASTCGFDSPTVLSPSQWNLLDELQSDNHTVPPRSRWNIEPGAEVTAEELQASHRVNWPKRRPRMFESFHPPNTITSHPDKQNIDLLISHHTPNLFLLGAKPARNVQTDPRGDGSLLIWVDNRVNNHVMTHIESGRALRLFSRDHQGSATARYAGQYIIDQQDPIITELNRPGFSAATLWVRALG